MGANIASLSQRHSSLNFSRRKRTAKDTQLDSLLSRRFQHPRSIDEIVKCTRFTKAEVRLLYRSFKQQCPGGSVNEERLRAIYIQFFPQGNAVRYARHIFAIIDRNHKGACTFDDYILTLSVLCRGTIDEKLRWIFRFYDINGEGLLAREDIAEMIRSLYDLLGLSVQPVVDERHIQNHIDEIFYSISPMRNEHIAVEDFIEYCKRRPQLIDSIQELSCCL
ncbi:hypothetical protein I4U23_001968 [Adineta vaga]|nr:hypothetical protein I4U23_001968 [Adineta vaga]